MLIGLAASSLTVARSMILTGSPHYGPMPFSKLFRNRWAALLWAGGILWTAVDVAGFAPARSTGNTTAAAPDATPSATDATGEVVENGDLAILASVMNGN